MTGTMRCSRASCGKPYTPSHPAQIYCGLSCAAAEEWFDRRAMDAIAAEREAELATLAKARTCRCEGDTPTVRDEDFDSPRCLLCGHDKPGRVAA